MKFCCAEKRLFFIGWLCMNRKIGLFRQSKTYPFTRNVSNCTQKPPFLQTQSRSFAQALPCRYPKQPFSTTNTANSHPAITYCPPKNTGILLSSALNPHAVTSERRTDSKPFRRRLVRNAGFGSCRRKFLLKFFFDRALNRGRRTESSP